MMLTRSVSKVDLVNVSLPRFAYLRAPVKRCLAVLIFVLVGASLCAAQGTFTAATCNRSDVNAVINGPTHTAVNGDTIIIPAGTCTWTSGITIAGKGITVTGSGTPNTGAGTVGAGTSTTTLVDNIDLSGVGGGSFFIFTGLTFGQTAKVELLNFNSASPSTVGANAFFTLQFTGTCTASGCANIRVDNITYGTNNFGNNSSDGGFIGTDNVFGVLDHNTASEVVSGGPPFIQMGYSAWAGVGNYGDNSFAAADSYGTANQMYLENNLFSDIRGVENDVSPTAGGAGGDRIVCRFNTFNHMSGTGICSAHATSWLGRQRGMRQREVYYNNVATAGGCDSVSGISGGTGLYFRNSVNTSAAGCNEFVRVDIARFIMNAAPWNACDGTQLWDQVPFTSGSTCFDQPGRGGGGALLQASNPVLASNPGTLCTSLGAGGCYPAAPLDPIYEIGDTSTVANVSTGIAGIVGGSHIQQNRDYYGEVSQTAQTSASAPFNGATGTGYGTLARRPTTCTTGVAYLATDQGTWNDGGAGGLLYKCTSTNTWTLFYTPYTYPHPLTGGGTSTTGENPSPPTNLTATVQ